MESEIAAFFLLFRFAATLLFSNNGKTSKASEFEGQLLAPNAFRKLVGLLSPFAAGFSFSM